MPRWHFTANDGALHTVIGERSDGVIRLRSTPGCGLFGPYVDLPAGACTARILLAGPGEGYVRMDIAAQLGQMVLASEAFDLREGDGELALSANIPEPLSQCEVRLHCAGNASADISGLEIEVEPSAAALELDVNRPVGFESRKSYREKIDSGFFRKYLAGNAVLELGYRGGIDGTLPIVPQAVGIDIDYPGYDGLHLPFPDASQDAVYSSHCFEHMENYQQALREWYRVLKVGGYLIIVVPHHHLFERYRDLPSRWNGDHKRFYTPASLLREIEEVFPPNTYRVRHLLDNDRGFDYSVTPLEAGVGCYEIELVVEKLRKPAWDLEDGTCRSYGAAEFMTSLDRRSPWFLETDFSSTDRCVIWGPYLQLAAGDWEVRYFFEAIVADDRPLAASIVLDVGQNAGRIASLALTGAEGRRMLQKGSADLRFQNASTDAFFEFRLFTQGKPFSGKLRFYGVFLNRLWDPRSPVRPSRLSNRHAMWLMP